MITKVYMTDGNELYFSTEDINHFVVGVEEHTITVHLKCTTAYKLVYSYALLDFILNPSNEHLLEKYNRYIKEKDIERNIERSIQDMSKEDKIKRLEEIIMFNNKNTYNHDSFYWIDIAQNKLDKIKDGNNGK